MERDEHLTAEQLYARLPGEIRLITDSMATIDLMTYKDRSVRATFRNNRRQDQVAVMELHELMLRYNIELCVTHQKSHGTLQSMSSHLNDRVDKGADSARNDGGDKEGNNMERKMPKMGLLFQACHMGIPIVGDYNQVFKNKFKSSLSFFISAPEDWL